MTPAAQAGPRRSPGGRRGSRRRQAQFGTDGDGVLAERGDRAHRRLAARDRWREVDTPGGPIQALLPPVSMPGREAAMGAVPALGQHTAAIRAELGLPPPDPV